MVGSKRQAKLAARAVRPRLKSLYVSWGGEIRSEASRERRRRRTSDDRRRPDGVILMESTAHALKRRHRRHFLDKFFRLRRKNGSVRCHGPIGVDESREKG